MKRPSFQFYPADWRNNAKLRRCSFHERGVWFEVLCLLHDSDEYGIARWPLKDLAHAVGCAAKDLHELIRKGVMKGSDTDEFIKPFVYTPRHAGKDGPPVTLIPAQKGPIWYSSRMVTDEYVRQQRGKPTQYSASPDETPKVGFGESLGDGPKVQPNFPPMPGFGDGSTSSSASASLKPPQTLLAKEKVEERSYGSEGVAWAS